MNIDFISVVLGAVGLGLIEIFFYLGYYFAIQKFEKLKKGTKQ